VAIAVSGGLSFLLFAAIPPLTRREIEVLTAVAEGLRNTP
jgi:DNA-binding NarL/FixJ family response regulator